MERGLRLGILCTEDQSVVNQLPHMTVLKTPSVTEYRWEYDGKSWALKTKEHAAFSNARKKMIGFKLDENCAFAAESVVHRGVGPGPAGFVDHRRK